MSEELGLMVKTFLDIVEEESNLNGQMKDIRQTKKAHSTAVMKVMDDRDLKKVRVLTHRFGPTDINRIKKNKKGSTYTPKVLRKILEDLQGATLQEDIIESIMNRLKKPDDKQVEVITLQVKKLKVEESATPTVVGD